MVVNQLLTAHVNQPGIRDAIIQALSEIAPYASKAACDSMIHLVFSHLKNNNSFARERAVAILKVIGLRASETQLHPQCRENDLKTDC